MRTASEELVAAPQAMHTKCHLEDKQKRAKTLSTTLRFAVKHSNCRARSYLNSTSQDHTQRRPRFLASSICRTHTNLGAWLRTLQPILESRDAKRPPGIWDFARMSSSQGGPRRRKSSSRVRKTFFQSDTFWSSHEGLRLEHIKLSG